jgi:hypothetical protein
LIAMAIDCSIISFKTALLTSLIFQESLPKLNNQRKQTVFLQQFFND